MLCAIRKTDNEKVNAWLESKSNKPFACPECSDEVILKKGSIKCHHFSHKPPYDCEFGAGESEQHRKCKIELYNLLKSSSAVSDCEMEKGLGSVRPDIFFKTLNISIAIEVQISSLSLEDIIYRTIEYGVKGIHLLWLPIFSDRLLDKRYSPKIWEKWLHTTYFGRVYYWHSELKVVPVHFDEHQLYVEERSWFESGGNEVSAGGYYKKSKRFRTPNLGRSVNILRDFRPTSRNSLCVPDYTIPECRLLIDKQSTWWE